MADVCQSFFYIISIKGVTMKDGEDLSERQKKLSPLTIGELKRIIKRSKLPDDTPLFADYPKGWSGIFQVYMQDGSLFLLASDSYSDSGIGGNYNNTIDTLMWEAEGLRD